MILTKIKDKIAYFRSHPFVRNAAVLQAGSVSANVIQALIGIALARVFQPELYGIYALAFGLAGLLNVFLGLGAQDAVTTILSAAHERRDRTEMRDALAFLVKMTLFTGTLTLLGAIAAPYLGKVFYDSTSIGVYAGIVMSASVISTTVFTFTTIFLQIIRRIGTFTALTVSDQLLRSGLALVFVIMMHNVLGAALGHLVGAGIIFVASLIVWRRVRREHQEFPSVREILSRAKTVELKKYFGFSFWIALDRNIANLYSILPVLLTGLYVAKSEVTFFKLAFAYVNLALSFLGPISTLLNVEFPKMQVGDDERLARNFVKVSLYSLGLSTLLTLGAVIAAPLAFKIMYGEAFLPSVKYTFGLFAYGALMGIGVGLGSMWRTLERVKTSIIINTVTLGVGIPTGIVLVKIYGLWGSVLMVTLWYSVSHWFSFIYLARLTARRTRGVSAI